MTVLEALRAARVDADIDAREARLLLAHAMHAAEAHILGYPEEQVGEAAYAEFSRLLLRRKKGEPIAYMVGEKEFYGLTLEVTPAVLVPRPETELLVELALQREFSSLADLGTGSGAIAVALKKHRPAARVVAVDASAAALEVARRNAGRHGLAIEFRQGSWLVPLRGERFDLIVANPPYVAAGDAHLGEGDLRHEPPVALTPGDDGLGALRTIVGGAPAKLAPAGWLAVEHGYDQSAAVTALFAEAGFAAIEIRRDLAGIRRVVAGRLG